MVDEEAQLPSVLATAVHELRNAGDPLLLLWSACDLIEMCLRTTVAFALGDWQRAGVDAMPGQLRKTVASAIDAPTLGRWNGLASVLTAKLPKDTELDGIKAFAERLDSVLRGAAVQATVESSVFELRNRLAHGGGMSRALAARLWTHHEDAIETIIDSLGWLDGWQVSALCDGQHYRLQGLNAQLDAATAISSHWQPGDAYACRHNTQLPLAPIIRFEIPVQGDTRGKTPTTLVYARQVDAHTQLMTPIGSHDVAMAESPCTHPLWRSLATVQQEPKGYQVEGFAKSFRREASRCVGRDSEAETIVTSCNTPGVYWLTGPAGIGKSTLMSKVYQRLVEAPAQSTADAPTVLGYQFREGDARNSRTAFLDFALERLKQVESGGKQSPRNRLSKALEGSSTIFVLDGLDELASNDPDFVTEVVAPHKDQAVWLCAGRPVARLQGQLDTAGAQPLLSGALPPLDANAVRAMLFAKIGPLTKRLLARDGTNGLETDAVVNPFVDQVLRNADGLAIYVAYVIGDILSGKLGIDDEQRLPPSLADYHSRLLSHQAVGDLHQVLTPLVATLAALYNPPTPTMLVEILSARHISNRSPQGREVVDHALRLTTAFTQIDDNGRVAIFHTSLREFILNSQTTQIATSTARATLAGLCLAQTTATKPSELRTYALRFTIKHLLDAGDWQKAHDTLTDFGYLERRLMIESSDAVQADYRLAMQAAPANKDTTKLASWQHFLERHAHQLHGSEFAFLQQAYAEADESAISQAAEQRLAHVPPTRPWLRRQDRPRRPSRRALLRSFRGHRAAVRCADIREGRLATGGGDGTVRIWDFESGEQELVLSEGADSLTAARVTSAPRASTQQNQVGLAWTVSAIAWLDTYRVAACIGNASIKVWDTRTQVCMGTLEGHTSYIWSLALSPKGLLASGSDDGSVRLWRLPDPAHEDLARADCVATLAFDGWVCAAQFTPDGQRIIAAGQNGWVRVWSQSGGNEQTWELDAEFGRGTANASAIAIVDNDWVATGDDDGHITRWRLQDGRREQAWQAHQGPVLSIDYDRKRDRLVSSGNQGDIALWTAHGDKVRRWRAHSAATAQVAVSGGNVLSCGDDKTVKLWDPAVPSEQARPGHEGRIATLYPMVYDTPHTNEATDLLTKGDDGTIKLWVVDRERVAATMTLDGLPDGSLWCSPLGTNIIALDDSGQLYRAHDGNWQRAELPPLRCAALGTQTAVAATHEGALIAIDDTFVCQKLADLDTVVAIAVGDHRLVAAQENNLWLVDSFDDSQARNPTRLGKHDWTVSSAAVAHNDSFALVGYADGKTTCWNLASRTRAWAKADPAGVTNHVVVALSTDGQYAAWSIQDQLWVANAGDGDVIAHWRHADSISAIVFTGSRNIVIGDNLGCITRLHLENG